MGKAHVTRSDDFEASFKLRFSNSIRESVKEGQILKMPVFE